MYFLALVIHLFFLSFSNFPFVTQPSFIIGVDFSFTGYQLELEWEVTVSTKSNADGRVLKPFKVVQ